MSYTPGPWEPAGRFGQEIRRYWVGDGASVMGSDLGGVTTICVVKDAEGDRKANARLICKSPNMYRWMARLRECSIQGLAKVPDEMYEELAEILSAIEEGGQ